jgi:CO/xanthine dehydrogenase Mo-binding subunit/CO/xanthine dehydrogenase FAD-binding subunit
MTIGRRTRSIEWDARTSGGSRYVADVVLPGTLVARVLRSPHPHARILSLDAAAAARMPGVAAVLTARDLSDRLYKHEGGRLSDRRPLARDVVRFVGEEVAVVAAETAAQAEAALGAIRARYEPLPAVTTVAAALADGAPRLHARASGTNVSLVIERAYGDVEAGRRAAAATATGRYRFGRQAHACMEPNGTLARWDPEARRLELWTSTQSPYFVREEVARILDLDMDQVVVREIAVGGGFGSKSKIADQEALAGALAVRTGRPVRLVLSRAEEFATTKCRHAFDVDLTTGVDKDGRLTHREAGILVDNGAYNHSGASVTGAAVAAAASWYRTGGGVHVRATLVDTNKHPGGQFRGYGHPQIAFAIESQMDELARACGRDPIDFRILNAHRSGDVTRAGWRLHSAHLVECLEAVRDAIGWREKRARAGTGRGVGVAVAMHVSGARTYEHANRADAGVDVRADGTVRIRFGGADPGTGQKTALAQVAAEELGVDLSRITVVTMDSEETPFDLGSWSSRGTVMGVHAVGTVARSAARRLRELAADKLGVPAESVLLRDGHAVAGDARVPIEDLVTTLGGALDVTESAVVDTELVNFATGVADISPAYAFAAHAVEVEVDRDTGTIRVVQVVAAHDCGTAINPTAVESQIVGGVVMGLGAALSEELLYEGGRLINPAYLHYALPRAADAPPVRTIILGHADPHSPYGVKGVGEISMVPVAPAVANAVAHAVGVRIRELPITPDKVLTALRAQDGRRRRYHVWRRPRRWWIASMRWAYPRGVHALLHRWGTGAADPTPPAPVAALERPAAMAEALTALSRDRAARPLGGGTDLLPLIEQGLARPTRLVDLGGVTELDHVSQSAAGDLLIGAGVTLSALARRPEVAGDQALRQAIASIASPQIREMATVGGNLCQAKRCWFYRNGFDCYKRRGVTAPCYAVLGDNRYYHAVLGAHRCQAVTPSDLATVLVALDATVRIASRRGERALSMARFYTGPGETALRPDELITSVTIPAAARARVSGFEKLRLWEGDFSVVSACASLDVADGRVRNARIVLGAIAPTPYRARAVEQRLRGQRLDPSTIIAAAEAWTRAAHPLPGNAWKVDAACGLLRRCLEACRAEHGA